MLEERMQRDFATGMMLIVLSQEPPILVQELLRV